MNEFLTPNSPSDVVSAANSGSGDDAQNAYSAEYNAFAIKTNTVVPLAEQTLGNNVGVVDPVGGSTAQSQAGTVLEGTTVSDSKRTSYNNGVGYWIGIDADGLPKLFIGNSAGVRLLFDGSTIDFNGPADVASLDIPDTTTANSFHVDSTGNAWWGANVATGYTGANAYVLKDGSAVFKSVSIGGTSVQYVITNSGIFSYGDGSDGDFTTSGSLSLTSDMYYNNLTVSTGDTLNPAGYRIFVKNTLTINGTGKIARNGVNGSVGGNGTSGSPGAGGGGGAGGTALADGYLKGSLGGGSGGNGGTQPNPGSSGSATANTTNSLGSNASNSGAGGNASNSNGAGAVTGATRTTANVKLTVGTQLAWLLDVSSTGSTVKYDNSPSGTGGSGGGVGGGASTQGGGGGGGGGSAGGIIAIYAKDIVIGASASITANGGNGGNGGNGASGSTNGGGGGGGGGGGNGGIVILTYNTLTNSGSIAASGGTKGTGGTAGTPTTGQNGSNGVDGSAGTIYQFQLSL